jgi:hypothetical protein
VNGLNATVGQVSAAEVDPVFKFSGASGTKLHGLAGCVGLSVKRLGMSAIVESAPAIPVVSQCDEGTAEG